MGRLGTFIAWSIALAGWPIAASGAVSWWAINEVIAWGENKVLDALDMWDERALPPKS